MTTTQPQVWKPSTFTIESREGKTPGTVIFRLAGPFTARNMFASLTPVDLRNMLDLQSMPGSKPPTVNIFDLTEVPYMDSTGLGQIVSHHVRCRNNGVQLIAVGVSPRVLELFKMTRVDTVIPMVGTVEEADSA
jgi:anti-anti-sigma factor